MHADFCIRPICLSLHIPQVFPQVRLAINLTRVGTINPNRLPEENTSLLILTILACCVNDNVHNLSIIIRKVETPWLGVEADRSWLLGYRPACGSIKMWCTADSCHIRHHRSLLGRIAISVKPNLRRPQPFVLVVGSDFLPWSRLQLQGKLSGRLEQCNEFAFCENLAQNMLFFICPLWEFETCKLCYLV